MSGQRRAIFDKNNEWIESDPRRPDYDESKILYTCVGGNHITTFLKMVKKAIACECFCSEGGNICPALLKQVDAEFADAANKRLPCIVLKREIRDIPGALLDVQSSENAAAGIYTPESDKQCILKCAAAKAAGHFKDELQLKKSLAGQFPQLKDHIADCIHFADRMGGVSSVHFQHWKMADGRFGSAGCQFKGE